VGTSNSKELNAELTRKLRKAHKALPAFGESSSLHFKRTLILRRLGHESGAGSGRGRRGGVCRRVLRFALERGVDGAREWCWWARS
jgi:hypothetical protein